MKRTILIEIETDVSGENCATACIGLCGYYCDIYGKKVTDRTRLKECRDAEMYKGTEFEIDGR